MLLEHDDVLLSLFTAQPALAPAEPTTTDPISPLDPSVVNMLSILQCLHAEHTQGRAQVPLAALCKRLELRMSTLQRLMTALSEQAMVEVEVQKDRLVASLTASGAEVALALQAV